MAKEIYMSKAFAIITVALTVSAIAGIVTMVIIYEAQMAGTVPTPRPTTPAPTTFPTGPPPDWRLPENLRPKSYVLLIRPHLYTSINTSDVNATEQNMLFDGHSTVVFHCVARTQSIFLHSNNLTLMEMSVKNVDNNEELTITRTEQHDDGSNFLEIEMFEVLQEGGNYSLYVEFSGEIKDDLSGLYYGVYKEDGLMKYFAVTQMEPIDARKVFPCFDEPALKATFDVTIIHRVSTTALGNWGVEDSRIIDEEWKFTKFYNTRLMSTYLLAFTVSEFPSTPPDGNRVKIKTHGRREAIEAGHAKYATEITKKLLNFYESQFGIDYSQTKLDQFVVPDHSAGAMENWGLITYVESMLYYDKKTSSSLQKEWVVDIIAHELAHQWFGNLVTMRWWNDLWLNEGFASYMSLLGMDHAEPDWNFKQMKELEHQQRAFEVDALESSHPLSAPAKQIQTWVQISDQFSTISYLKGSAVLKMLEDLVTEPVFHAGIKMYLKKFQYSNVVTQDLWDYMQKAAEEGGLNYDVAEVMNTWTQQTGYPVLTINTTNGEVSQRQYSQEPLSTSDRVWNIPIRVMSQKEHVSLVFLDSGNPVMMDQFLSKDKQWILANVNASGYYRVNYDPENWRRLMDQLQKNPEVIPLMNRGQLIYDAFHLSRAGLVNVTLGLNTTRFLQHETSGLPWQAAISNLDYIMEMFDRSVVYGPMQAYMQKLVKPLYDHFENYTKNGTIPTDHSQQESQVTAITVACSNGLPKCQHMVLSVFREWMQNETYNRIHPNLRAVIYCQAVAAGGDEEWEFLWKMWLKKTVVLEEQILFGALCCTKQIWLLNRLLDYTLDPEADPGDAIMIINGVGDNVAGLALAWNFVRAHWTYIKEELHMGIGSVLHMTRRFSTQFELVELIEFQSAQNLTSMSMNQAIEQTTANMMWVKENKQTILEWFLDNLDPDKFSIKQVLHRYEIGTFKES